MPGQHIKVRRIGQANYEIAETKLKRQIAPVQGEFINVVVKGVGIRAKIVAFNESVSGSTATYEILAVEDDGNPPGHREATEKDFE
jgi:hypothetical protein